jgi:hypothetical protein
MLRALSAIAALESRIIGIDLDSKLWEYLDDMGLLARLERREGLHCHQLNGARRLAHAGRALDEIYAD